MRQDGPGALRVEMPRNDSGESIGAFSPLRATPSTPSATSEFMEGLARGQPEALRLDNRHGPLGRVMTRGLPLGPGHDFPTTQRGPAPL
jgi:hypothetical protein